MAEGDRRRNPAPAAIPAGMDKRLAELRRLYVPEPTDEAQRRLDRERPRGKESFDQAIARRLRELRALCDLANHLR